MRRMLLVVVALTVPASALSLAMTGGVASAAGPKGKTVCTTVSGTVASGMLSISGCTDANGANTGGGAHPFGFGTLAAGGTLTWNSGFMTTFATPTLTPTSAKHCPGYSKTATTNPTADNSRVP